MSAGSDRAGADRDGLAGAVDYDAVVDAHGAETLLDAMDDDAVTAYVARAR